MKIKFPEDLTVLAQVDLDALRVAGLAAFDTLYSNDFASIADADVTELSRLTDGLTKVDAELSSRADRESKLDGVSKFATVTGTFEGEIDEPEEGEGEEGEEGDEGDEEITAGGGGDAPAFSAPAATEETIVAYATGEGLGVSIDAPLTWAGVGTALDRRLNAFNATPYQNAARSGRPLKQIQSFARFSKAIPENQMVRDSGSRGVIRKAVEAARDQSRLQGSSLIAAGGWGAPSQISYDRFPKLSSRAGIASFPEIGVEHGGIQTPTGSDFSDVYASTDFISFDEDEDEAGTYEENGSGTMIVGAKPVYRLPGTDWTDHRLKVDGIHIQSGILESRGYPEGVAAEVAQVLDAHAHIINAKVLAEVVAGSTAISFAAGQAGSTAPVLAAVELQVLHYRDTHRMEFNEALEAKFPNWLRGAIRADLSRRLGVDMFDVSDARIDGFFRDRGVSVEWVYDWQSIATTAAASFLAPPSTVSFLLYAAGTWIKGVSDVISLDTMYDSTLLGTNDYTVLFSEEGWFTAKVGTDSRVISVPISSDGATHIGVEIANNGTTV